MLHVIFNQVVKLRPQVFRDVDGIRWRPMPTHGPSLSWNSLVTWSGHLPHAPHQRSLEPVTVEERWRREPVLPRKPSFETRIWVPWWIFRSFQDLPSTKKNMKKLATWICYIYIYCIILLYYAIFIVSRRFSNFYGYLEGLSTLNSPRGQKRYCFDGQKGLLAAAVDVEDEVRWTVLDSSGRVMGMGQ